MTRLQPVDFFLLKRCCFDFFIKNNSDDLMTQSKPKTQALNWTGSKNYGLFILLFWVLFIYYYMILKII